MTCKQCEKKNAEASLLSFFFFSSLLRLSGNDSDYSNALSILCRPLASMKSLTKRFHIPPSYTFASEYGHSATVISLAPFVSSCSSPLNCVGGLRPHYQQQKFLLSSPTRYSSPSPDSATIHGNEDDPFETPPSTNSSLNERSRKNPFEILSSSSSAAGDNQVCQFVQSVSTDHARLSLGQAIVTCSKSFHRR